MQLLRNKRRAVRVNHSIGSSDIPVQCLFATVHTTSEVFAIFVVSATQPILSSKINIFQIVLCITTSALVSRIAASMNFVASTGRCFTMKLGHFIQALPYIDILTQGIV